ncbi:hypothetical protein [Klebsiella pneumoniae]|uniref:hypothetical protein n=1 Tax=Klebsiella pneumoniae TaxID=573 RepID=UPI0009C50CCA|nr:hypothetical protein [Klebsiella pneumoniae]SLS06978.1 Uncharacterised protein [Klebsiella pneumoniae]
MNSIAFALQYKITTAATSQITLYNKGAYYLSLRAGGYIAAIDEYLKSKPVAPADSIPVTWTPEYFVPANGSSIASSSGRVTVPSGSTGAGTRYGRFEPVHNNRNRAGETVRLVSVFTTSDKLLAKLNSYTVGVASKINDTITAASHIPGTGKAIMVNANTLMISADYVIAGGQSEFAAVYIQLNDESYSLSERTITPTFNYFFFPSEGETTGDIARVINQRKITSGNMADSILALGGQVFNGGYIDQDTKSLGIPEGSTGANSYIQPFMSHVDLVKFPKSRVKLSLIFTTSPDFTTQSHISANLRVNLPTGQFNNAADKVRVKKLSSTLVLAEFIYTLTGAETAIAPYVQIVSSSSVRTSEGLLALTDIRAEILDSSVIGDTLNDQMLRIRESVLRRYMDAKEASVRAYVDSALSSMASSTGVRYTKTITIKQDGTGDFSTLTAAIAANGGGTSYNDRIKYEAYEGVYSDINIIIPRYADIVGVGQRNRVWFKGEMPDTVAPNDIPRNQTFWMNNTSKIENLKITAKNMRYPVHQDSIAYYGDGTPVGQVLDVIGCYIEHYGNYGAQNYQNSIGSGVTVWSSLHAWGGGLHSGQRVFTKNTDFVSPTSPFYYHTQADFDKPCLIECEGGSMRNTSPGGGAVFIQNMGSGQCNTLNLKGVTLQGLVIINNNTWLAKKLKSQWGDRNAEMQVHITSSSPVPVQSTNSSSVLCLMSKDVAGSSVEVSGTAMAALFGYSPEIVSGGLGYPGRVYSYHSVKGEVAGGLIGQRLGDCTTSNKSLIVKFENNAAVTLTLNLNYTAMSNEDVVSSLNALLADNEGRGFSVVNPFNASAPVYQEDRELIIYNTTSTVIKKGTAVAFEPNKIRGRTATSADPRRAVAGIALENIAQGKAGRVQVSGHIHATAIAFSGTAPTNLWDTCSVATDGTIVAGSEKPILQYIGYSSYEIV